MADDDVEAKVKEQARQVSEGVSATLSDAERTYYTKAAHEVAEGLLEAFASPYGPTQLAATISKMFAMVHQVPVKEVANQLDANIVCYALAAGVLAGVYDTGVPTEEELEDDAIANVGQYL